MSASEYGTRRTDHAGDAWQELIPAALRAVAKGGVVVCGAIPHERHPLLALRGALWRAGVRSVAKLTRADGEKFLALAPRVPVRTEVRRFALEEADEALGARRRGAAVAEVG